MVGGWQRRISWRAAAFAAMLLALPLLATMLWGTFPDGEAYTYLSKVRQLSDNLAAWPRLFQADGQSIVQSPGFTLCLVALSRLGLPLLGSAVVVSALSWGLLAIAIYGAGWLTREPVAGTMGALMIVLAPTMLAALATPRIWYVFLLFLALVATWQGLWKLQSVSLLLALLTYFALPTWLVVLGLLGLRWATERRPPVLMLLISLTVAAGWFAVVSRYAGPVSVWVEFDPDDTIAQLTRSGYPVQWLWLFAPAAGLGLAAVYRALSKKWLSIAALLLFLLFLLLVDGALSALLVTTAMAISIAIGLNHLLRRSSSVTLPDRDRSVTPIFLAIVVVLPFLLLQGMAMGRRFVSRPIDYWHLERQAGRWLEGHSDETVTVHASAHVTYIADRATSALPANGYDGTLDDPPDYLVLARNLANEQLMHADWFREGYVDVASFSSPYDAAAPLTVWGYRPTVFNLGESQPANVKTNHDLEVVGYRYDPKRLQPGQPVHVSLFVRATGPAAGTFEPILRLVASDGQVVTELVGPTVSAVRLGPPNQVVEQTFVLRTTEQMAEGAYTLRLSLRGPGESSVWGLYRNNDRNPLDSVNLGFVGLSKPVAPEDLTEVGALFGEQIRLAGYMLNDGSSPGGEPIRLTLYWAPEEIPSQEYVVFVHLIDQSGQLIAGDDNQPAQGRYPTTAWLPGDLIADQHLLPLDENLPPGDYQLYAGLYLPDSGERLPVVDGQGNEVPSRSLPIATITIP